MYEFNHSHPSEVEKESLIKEMFATVGKTPG